MKHRSYDSMIVKGIAYLFVGFFAVVAILPFISLVMSSFASEYDIINNGYRLWPGEFSLDAYKFIFKYPETIYKAYGITTSITVLGTAISLFFGSMAAYVMFRREVRYRMGLAFFLYFTELFNGGLAAFFIVVSKMLHLKNSYFVLLLVPMFSVFNILILRNFIRGSIPYSLVESAKIDGANDFKTFISIVLPLCKPALASIGLFTALIYWNDWWTAMMFVEDRNLHTLQYTLYKILSSTNISSNMAGNIPLIDLPKESVKLALTVVSTGPIILAYPFVQKYFVKGVTIGSVKE